MSAGTLLGFDYGIKSIGVAVGHVTTRLAQPLTAIHVFNNEPDWPQLNRLINEWQPTALVVGLPLNMDDSVNAMTDAAKRFGDRLAGRYNLPVHMVDERLTSVAAKNALLEAGVALRPRVWSKKSKRNSKSRVDQLAAQTILQAYLDELPREHSVR